MMFPKLDTDSLVQIKDMFRICASGSFSTVDEAITEAKIYPDFINQPLVSYPLDVTCPEDMYLDWAYMTAGEYTVRLELTSATPNTEVLDVVVTAITEEEDNLKADDACLYAYESELKKYLPYGRNSWKYIHRKALEEILDWLYRNCKFNKDGTRITKDQLLGDDLVKWATYEAMLLIYQDIKTSNSEAFNEKILEYKERRGDARNLYLINYDSNKDGIIDENDTPTNTKVSFFTR